MSLAGTEILIAPLAASVTSTSAARVIGLPPLSTSTHSKVAPLGAAIPAWTLVKQAGAHAVIHRRAFRVGYKLLRASPMHGLGTRAACSANRIASGVRG